MHAHTVCIQGYFPSDLPEEGGSQLGISDHAHLHTLPIRSSVVYVLPLGCGRGRGQGDRCPLSKQEAETFSL